VPGSGSTSITVCMSAPSSALSPGSRAGLDDSPADLSETSGLGRLTTNLAPVPPMLVGLSAQILPSCSLTMAFDMARPRPLPPRLLVADMSTW